MKFYVDMRSGARQKFIEAALTFYIRELKLERSRYMLGVVSEQKMTSQFGCYAGVIQASHDVITMVIDSKIKGLRLIQTIAHEMVHVKQIAKGRMQNRVINGEFVNVWNGQVYALHQLAYHRRPWELEAFRQERELAYRLLEVTQGELK